MWAFKMLNFNKIKLELRGARIRLLPALYRNMSMKKNEANINRISSNVKCQHCGEQLRMSSTLEGEWKAGVFIMEVVCPKCENSFFESLMVDPNSFQKAKQRVEQEQALEQPQETRVFGGASRWENLLAGNRVANGNRMHMPDPGVGIREEIGHDIHADTVTEEAVRTEEATVFGNNATTNTAWLDMGGAHVFTRR